MKKWNEEGNDGGGKDQARQSKKRTKQDIRDTGLIPGLRRSPGEGNGSPLQYSCLGNPMDKGAWWDTVHRVTKIWS